MPAAKRKGAGDKTKAQSKATLKNSVTSQSKLTRSENPMDWVFDNPLGAMPGFVFAVLKKSYQGHPNSAVEFGGRKLRPILGVTKDGAPDPDVITAYRTGTVLPTDAPDAFDEPEVLLRAIDAFACDHEASLLIYVTLSFPEATRAHHSWEEARAFSLEAFARKRKLPVCLIQHRPGEVGSDNPIHLHLLVGARRLDGTGFRGYAEELLCDDGQQVIYDEWQAFRKSRIS